MSGNVTVLILGGGQGKRLFPLTSYRSKPAVPIGGKYRLVDIPISNSINSGLRKIFVLTQFNSTSLHRHIHRTYPYEFFHQTSVELLAAEQTLVNSDWFQGTADAVRQHIPHYHLDDDDTVLILSGDHLYRMDYQEILQFHQEKKADVTIATVPVPKRQVRHFGIMQIRSSGRITAFREKPSPEENIQSFVIPDTIRSVFNVKTRSEAYLASMGIYVFQAKALKAVLSGREADFGKEVIPKAIDRHKVYGYVFNGYWRDIGTIGAFYHANIELTHQSPAFRFFQPGSVIFTRSRFLPPTKIFGAAIKDVLIADGCILENSKIEGSVIGLRSVVQKGSHIRDSVIMGNDFYEMEKPRSKVPVGIGKNCKIRNCILDKNVRIGNGVTIANVRKVEEEDGENYHIRDGVVIIPKGVTIPDGTVI